MYRHQKATTIYHFYNPVTIWRVVTVQYYSQSNCHRYLANRLYRAFHPDLNTWNIFALGLLELEDMNAVFKLDVFVVNYLFLIL